MTAAIAIRLLSLMQKQKERLVQLKVTGVESVTAPAGTFECWKVEVGSAEAGPEKVTVWVSREGRKVVKTSATVPQANGAVMTMELLK
jgi:hypothetical protein